MTANTTCVVVDYGIGNVFSVCQAIRRVGGTPELTGDVAKIKTADRVILPGVGAFGRAAARLEELGLDNAIHEFVSLNRPFLGICVGMQLLMSTGHEFGETAGLNLFEGTVEKISATDENGETVRVPLIGWNAPRPLSQSGHDLWHGTPFNGVQDGDAFYFVHSYSVRPRNEADILAVIDAGNEQVVAAIGRDNIFGVQFHPERSAKAGMRFLENFLTL